MGRVVSFGRRYGVGSLKAADRIIDVRGVPNPYHIQSFRGVTGKDPRVREWVLARAEGVVEGIIAMVGRQGCWYLAICCEGGKHRSVVIAEEVARRLGWDVYHRDISRSP